MEVLKSFDKTYLSHFRPNDLIVSDSNAEAVEVCRTFLKNVGSGFQMLILKGPPGVGKSHLIGSLVNLSQLNATVASLVDIVSLGDQTATSDLVIIENADLGLSKDAPFYMPLAAIVKRSIASGASLIVTTAKELDEPVECILGLPSGTNISVVQIHMPSVQAKLQIAKAFSLSTKGTSGELMSDVGREETPRQIQRAVLVDSFKKATSA